MARPFGGRDRFNEQMGDIGLAVDALGRPLDGYESLYAIDLTTYCKMNIMYIRDYFSTVSTQP